MKAETQLNCSIGIGVSRLVAKVSSAKAKPNGILWVVPGEEAKLLAPLDVRDIPGVGKVTEKNLQALGINRVGDQRASTKLSLRSTSVNGDWRWPARRAERMPADGSTAKWERIQTPSPSAMSTPTRKIRQMKSKLSLR